MNTPGGQRIADGADRLLTARDIAAMFSVSLPRAYAILAGGEIPTVRLGRSVRVSQRKLWEWIDAQADTDRTG